MSRAGKSSKGRARRATTKQLELPQVLDMKAAAPLAQTLLSHRGAELSLDASGVRRLGSQCVQVLLAAAATWKADGKRLSLVQPSEEFLEGSRILGIQLDQDMTGREQVQ